MPFDHPALSSIHSCGDLDAFIRHPKSNLSGAPKFCKLTEYETKRLPYSLIWVHLQFVIFGTYIAYRHTRVQLTASGFTSQCLLQPLSQDRELELTECSLQPKKQSIIHML